MMFIFNTWVILARYHGNQLLNKSVSVATNCDNCVDRFGCVSHIAMEILYPCHDIKGFYGDKVAIPQGFSN